MECPKCGYVRQLDGTGQETECPRCGAVYAKATASVRKAKGLMERSHPVPLFTRIKQGFVWVLILAGVFSIAGKVFAPKDKGVTESGNAEIRSYEADWQNDFHVGITRALAKNGVKVCAQYKFKRQMINRGEYLVHCSPDGQVWFAYQVWEYSEKVMGPYQP